MEINAMPKMTNARLILIRELQKGPKRRVDLALAFYGEARYKGMKAQTSFNNKLKDGKALGILEHDPVNHIYTIGEVGKQMLAFAAEHNISLDVKSEAQISYEQKQA